MVSSDLTCRLETEEKSEYEDSRLFCNNNVVDRL